MLDALSKVTQNTKCKRYTHYLVSIYTNSRPALIELT